MEFLKQAYSLNFEGIGEMVSISIDLLVQEKKI